LTDKLDEAIPQSDKKNFPEFSTLLDKITENLLEPEYRPQPKIRWGGTDAWKQSQDRVKNLSKEDMDIIKKESDELMREIAAISNNDPAGPAAQALIARHYAGLKHFYEPNLELYRGLAEMYVADPRFQAYHDKFKPGLARFMQSAMIAFCDYQEKP
jgi:hypothetical protein